MQQPRTTQNNNPENINKPTKKGRRKKTKNTRTSTQKTLTDQPRKHKPTTENIPSENQPRKGFLLRFQDRDFWVWDFEKRVWMFEEGVEEKGRTIWRRTVLGWQMEKEKKKEKKNEGRRWSTDSSSMLIFQSTPALPAHRNRVS